MYIFETLTEDTSEVDDMLSVGFMAAPCSHFLNVYLIVLCEFGLEIHTRWSFFG